MLDRFQFQLCDIQGRLFELSVKHGLDSAEFIKAFMTSQCAVSLDDTYDRLQWAGYLYRYWHFYTGQSSKEIFTIADANMMNEAWLGFHTLDNEMAIDDLMEIYEQRKQE